MSYLIFKLKNVTFEEADEVRQLLAAHNIGFYETDAGFFGTSVAGLWLEDYSQQQAAKALLEDYADQRQQRVRAEYQLRSENGELETLWQRCRKQPLRVVLATLAIGFVLYFSIVPFYQSLL